MAKVRVTKRFHFEMAHTLYGYDGLCCNIHGHSYNLEVTISGEPLNKPGHPKDGMILDFGDLKNIVRTKITERFDHSLMVNRLVPTEQLEMLKKTTGRLIIVGFQPTTENIVTHIAGILQENLPPDVSLFSVRLYETVTAFAEWFASDN
jgi:6-pyruvoyltetrahydropterin/6-carboxytetrahydropterin synthase